MAFWKKRSEDPWDRDPNDRPAVTFSEAEPEETEEPEKKSFFADLLGGGEEPEEAPVPVPCPYCGAEMELGYLIAGRGDVHLAKGKPKSVWGSFAAEFVSLNDGGFWSSYKVCQLCSACRKLVIDVPEIDGAWSAELPAETPDEAADEAYERYLEQLKHYQ